MAFEGEKWRHLDLTHACVIEWDVLEAFFRLFQVFKHPKYWWENWGFSIFYVDTWAWDECANRGGANTGVMRGGHFCQLGSIAFLATKTTGEEILVAFWPKHGLRSNLRVPNFKNFSWGSMPPDPPSLFTFKRTQWPYQSKIAGSGPVLTCK